MPPTRAHRRPLRRATALLLASSLVALAACSDSTEDDGPGGAGGPDGTVAPGEETMRGITDDTIKVGGSIYDGFFGDARIGAEARIAEANAEGGVHGRTIELVEVANNENDPTTDLDIVRRLVEQEEVFALLPMMTGQPGAGDYVVENDIPMFGYGTNPTFCNNEVAFGVTGCVTQPDLKLASNALGTGLEQFFEGDTDKTIAFIGEDNDAGRGGIALLTASVEDKGFDVVYAEPVLPAPPDQLTDESPFVSELLAADGGAEPDVIYLQATLSGVNLAAALRAAGYEGMIITPSYSPLLLGQDGYDGVYVNTQFGMDPALPANAEMLEAVAEVDPDAQLSLGLLVGYRAADMFIEALDATGPDLSVESFLATLNGGDFTYEVEGVVGPSSWPQNHDEVVPCGSLSFVDGEEFEATIPLTCGDVIEVG